MNLMRACAGARSRSSDSVRPAIACLTIVCGTWALVLTSGCAAGAVREARVGGLGRYPDAARIVVEKPTPAAQPDLRGGVATGAGRALGAVGLADYPGAPGEHLTLRFTVLNAKAEPAPLGTGARALS